MRALLRAVLIALVFGTTSGNAADAPAYLVAGYKALFTCSATMLAKRTPQQIEDYELTGIYRDFEPVMRTMQPVSTGRVAGTFAVFFGKNGEMASARYRPNLGCSLLPRDASRSWDGNLPRVQLPPLSDVSRLPWPEGDQIQIPSDHEALSQAVDRGFDGKSYGERTRTSAVIVVGDGKIIDEHYDLGVDVDVPQRTWSVAKSITGALVGIAAKDGLLTASEPTRLAQWAGDDRANIRVIDLLHMMSGLEAGPAGNRTDEIYFGGGSVVDNALTHQLVAPPNTRWFYANDDALILSYLLRVRIGDEKKYLAYPYAKLFRRIGMNHTTAETDWDGTFILSSQVWTTARDLARFGMLLADDGVWQGQRILPEGWVKLMATPAPVQPPEKRSDGSLQPGYGGMIWLFGERHGLPEGTLAAMGNRGQYVVVVPSKKVVIVRRGFDGEDARFAIDKFSADVLKALK